MEHKLGYIARFGSDGSKIHTSYNPNYKWRDACKIHTKYFFFYLFYV